MSSRARAAWAIGRLHAYCASQSAIAGVTKVARCELGRSGSPSTRSRPTVLPLAATPGCTRTRQLTTVRKGFIWPVHKRTAREPSDLAGPLLFPPRRRRTSIPAYLYADGGYTGLIMAATARIAVLGAG